MPRILIADNELALVAKLEKFLLKKGYEVVGIAVSGYQAVNMALALNPDLLLMEMKLNGEMDGILAAKKIQESKEIPIVFLTWYGDEKSLFSAASIHSAGYVIKPFQPSQVQAAIEIALSNKNWHERRKEPASESKPFQMFTHQNTGVSLLPFTPAETRVARLVKMGMRSRDIALELKLAQSTVDWHRKNIRKKIGIAGNKTRNLMANLAFGNSSFSTLKP